MYKVLVVDDDATCLTVAKSYFRRYNYYEVVAVSHGLEVLSLLNEKSEEEKSYDVILADVHMPIMDGFELLRLVNNNFNVPVILISADDNNASIWKGFSHGAPAYLSKPLRTVDAKYLWQYSVLWKNREKNAYRRFRQANVPRSIRSDTSGTHMEEVSIEKKTNEVVWNPDLHNRFVEAILILGPTKAVPKNILEVMNAPSLDREQVASHLQKFKLFLKKVLKGETSLYNSKCWVDCNYYSRIVGGNPNVILLNQLRENQNTGKVSDPIPASLPLPPFNDTVASSSGSRNVNMLMPSNDAFKSLDVATTTQSLAGVTFQSTQNVCTPNYDNVVPQHNYHGLLIADNGGLMGRTNNNIFSSINHILPYTGTTPDPNKFISEHPFNMVSEGNNILFAENNFDNVVLQMENEQPNDPNIGNSFGAKQFEISSEMNNAQVGSAPSGDTPSKFGNAWLVPMNEHERRI